MCYTLFIMFPLLKRVLVHDTKWHVAHKEHPACDYEAVYVDVFAPFDGIVSDPYPWTFNKGSGGRWSQLLRTNGDKILFAHLSKRIKTGQVKKGDLIAITGNTGWMTYGAHLHIAIIVKTGYYGNTRYIDPESYDWGHKDYTVAEMFQMVWGRPAAKGEIMYFENRLAKGSIKLVNLTDTMIYIYRKYLKLELTKKGSGEDWWQKEKNKWNLA